MNKTSARILAVGLPLAAVAATGAAFAYWTSSGSGSASGSADSSVAAVSLATASAVTGLVPGGTIEVPVKATNPNAKTSVGIKTLTAGAVTSGDTACDLVSGATAEAVSPTLPVVVPAAGSASFGSVKITMENSETVNQDACKGKTFTVVLTAA